RDNLGLPDTQITNNRENQLKLIHLIRRYQPDIVLTSHWDTKHPDHIAASYLVTDSCHFAGLINIDTGQERWRPYQVMYFHLPHYVNPSFIVDITEVYAERMNAIAAYQSQFSQELYPQYLSNALSAPLFLKHIESRTRYYGSLINVEFAEAFYIKNHLEIKNPVGFFVP
ncbi:MAG: hypothetical protein A2Y62_00590, partial [Candidatus Fischerbacteria bacterium RBG_13_37_8]